MTVSCGRRRLEATLSSSSLSDKNSVFRLVRNQLSNTRPDVPSIDESLCSEVWNLLELLRSASGEENHNLVLTNDEGASRDGWKLKHDTGQLRVMYREGPKGSPFHTLLAEGLIHSPLTNALCVAWEAPSYKFWWPQMTVPVFKIVESCWIKRCQAGEDLSLIRVKLPWPFATREVLMYAFELEVFEEDLIIVLLHSVPFTIPSDETIYGLKQSDIPEASPDAIQMDLAGGFALQRLSSNQSYFRTIVNLDIKIDFMPPWLINFISRQLVGLGFKLYQNTLLSIMNEEGSSKHFQKLIRTEPMYARVDTGLQSKSANGSSIDASSALVETVNGTAATEESDSTEQGSMVTQFSLGRISTAFNEERAGQSGKLESSSFNEERAGQSGKLEISAVNEERAGQSGKLESSSFNEERARQSGKLESSVVGIDTEVERALYVLDKVIAFIRSSQSREIRGNPDNVALAHILSKDSDKTQCNGLPNHSHEITALTSTSQQLEMDVPIVQTAVRTENLILQIEPTKSKRRWYSFRSNPLCCV